MFKKQEQRLIIACIIIAIIMLYGTVKAFIRYMNYFG
ncbi:hypothetical protein J2T13_002821 [Paenibacillus sp. DS2015]